MNNDYTALLTILTGFLDRFANVAGTNNSPVTWTVSGNVMYIYKMFSYINGILPALLGFIAVVIAIKVTLKLLKRFSR